MRVVLVLFVCVVAAAVSLGARQAAVQSLYSLKVPALSGESVDLKELRGKGHPRRERRQPMRIHAAGPRASSSSTPSSRRAVSRCSASRATTSAPRSQGRLPRSKPSAKRITV